MHVERPAEVAPVVKSAAGDEDDDPFVELTSDGKPVGEAAPEEMPQEPAGDEEFTEVDLSHPGGRVVMGRGGLIELERPVFRPAAPAAPASDGPFTEILVGDEPAGLSNPQNRRRRPQRCLRRCPPKRFRLPSPGVKASW